MLYTRGNIFPRLWFGQPDATVWKIAIDVNITILHAMRIYGGNIFPSIKGLQCINWMKPANHFSSLATTTAPFVTANNSVLHSTGDRLGILIHPTCRASEFHHRSEMIADVLWIEAQLIGLIWPVRFKTDYTGDKYEVHQLFMVNML